MMTERRVRHAPVVGDGGLQGIVSIGDVVKIRIGELETERTALTNYITGSRGGHQTEEPITPRDWRLPAASAQVSAVLHGGEACVTISMSRAERADLGQRGAQPGAARRRTHADERTTVPVDTAEGGQVVRLAHLLRLNPPDGRSSHIEWQPEGHRRL